jgi:hypothetical protein
MGSMERDGFSAGNTPEPTGSGAGFGASSTGSTGSTSGTTGDPSVTAGDYGSAGASSAGAESGSLTDRARGAAGSARERLADVGSSVRERAGTIKGSLADALETGADRIRGNGDNALAGAAGDGTMALEQSGRLGAAGDRLAGGMTATADWIRDADIEGLKTGIERQVRDHPGRTLLIAAGLGYLLGKALRK